MPHSPFNFSYDFCQQSGRESYTAVSIEVWVFRNTGFQCRRSSDGLSLNENRHAEQDSRDERMQFHGD